MFSDSIGFIVNSKFLLLNTSGFFTHESLFFLFDFFWITLCVHLFELKTTIYFNAQLNSSHIFLNQQRAHLIFWENLQHMFLAVYSIQRPKGFKGPACRQQDFIPTRVQGHKLSDVIDAASVSDPHAIFRRAVLCDFFLAKDGRCRGLLCGLHFTGLCLLTLHSREDNWC